MLKTSGCASANVWQNLCDHYVNTAQLSVIMQRHDLTLRSRLIHKQIEEVQLHTYNLYLQIPGCHKLFQKSAFRHPEMTASCNHALRAISYSHERRLSSTLTRMLISSKVGSRCYLATTCETLSENCLPGKFTVPVWHMSRQICKVIRV